MVGAGQGFGVPGGIEETPNSIGHPPYGERGATLTSKIWIGTDVLSPATALRAKVASIIEQEFEGDLLEIAQFDGTDRTHMKDIDIIESGWEFSDKFSKMDVREMKRISPSLHALGASPTSGNWMDAEFILYLDSGAGHHVVYQAELLVNLRDPPPGLTRVKAADGALLAVSGFGDIQTKDFSIPDVCLVQGLKANLVSMGQLAGSRKICCSFDWEGCEVISYDDGSLVGSAVLRGDNQFVLSFLKIQ